MVLLKATNRKKLVAFIHNEHRSQSVWYLVLPIMKNEEESRMGQRKSSVRISKALVKDMNSDGRALHGFYHQKLNYFQKVGIDLRKYP